MGIRARLEAEERQRLSTHAIQSAQSKGRERPMEPCDLRTEFQRDRDRLLHCRSFRRLKYKTQCFLPDVGDHVRTRLTHTLEVSQVARTIARALRLNEDLAEAIALGHDLGHTCFGHMGERTLDRLSQAFGGFRHNEQSLRVVTRLERDGKGLNLCWETRDGILNHRSDGKPATLEGQAVSLADRIAYISHDIDDAIYYGVLSEREIPGEIREALGENHGKRIDAMVRDIILHSEGKDAVAMSPSMFQAMNATRAFLFEKVYLREEAKREEEKADRLIEALYRHYLEHPESLNRMDSSADLPTAINDQIAGMTDRFAIQEFRRLYIPQST